MCTKVAGILTGAVLVVLGSISAQAFPAAAVQADRDAGVTLVADRCGIGWFRGPEGHCHPDRERIVVEPGPVVVAPVAPIVIEPGRVCPPGTHLGPRRRECIVN